MGFLWFGKNIDTWKDVGETKDLQAQRSKLNSEWKLLLARKQESQSQFEKYLEEAEKDSTSDSEAELAAYEMGRITKAIRRFDEEINLTQVNLGILDGVLALKDAEKRDDDLGITLGKLSPSDLQATIIRATQARDEQKLNTKELHTVVTSQTSTLHIEVEKDDDMKAAMAQIQARKNARA